MKKNLLLLLLSSLLLSGCSFNQNQNPGKDDESSEEHQDSETHEDEHKDDETHEDDEHEEEHEDFGDYDFTLSDYENFSWHNGRQPEHNPHWEYHIKTTINPNGALYKNPNEKLEYCGVNFEDRNSYIISPTFSAWKKVEARFTFWCSAKTSTDYKAANDVPQMTIEEYDENGTKLGEEYINVKRSDIPSDNSPLKRTVYLKNIKMHYFIMRRTNYIPNGNSGYTMVLCDATLKGWDYE